MNIEFILPDIGEGIVECEIAEWLVKEGDTIEEDQPIADVMTDKALVQIPAMHNGVIEKLYYEQGDIAKVHEPLFSMVKHESGKVAKDKASFVADISTKDKVGNISSTPKVADESEHKQTHDNVVSANANSCSTIKSKSLASPAVRRVARELDVDINAVTGTGKKGRVYKDDILSFTASPVAQPSKQLENKVEPIRGVKAVMAKAMTESVSTIPHFTYCEEIDLSDLIALRITLKAQYQKQELMKDIKLTMMPFFMKAMSLALKEYPIINSQVNEACSEITYQNDHNIGMAVDSKVGLLVPNIKQVQNKSILDLAKDLTKLTAKARSGRVESADLKGGTITISNIGALGGTVATPIINKPEVAIVALGKVQQLPRFNDKGEVEARSIMQVSWSGDHRVIDGGTIARFCNLWKSYLEQPNTMLVSLA
jgi:2-oxoisovalerate dehydrogenase E2 component (dihydrolipoyl transacylase)